jgi:hypothetical protein
MAIPKCPICGGEFDRGMLQTIGHGLRYVSDNGPHGFFTGATSDDPQVNALVCLDCGHVEVYVDPKSVRNRIRK